MSTPRFGRCSAKTAPRWAIGGEQLGAKAGARAGVSNFVASDNWAIGRG